MLPPKSLTLAALRDCSIYRERNERRETADLQGAGGRGRGRGREKQGQPSVTPSSRGSPVSSSATGSLLWRLCSHPVAGCRLRLSLSPCLPATGRCENLPLPPGRTAALAGWTGEGDTWRRPSQLSLAGPTEATVSVCLCLSSISQPRSELPSSALPWHWDHRSAHAQTFSEEDNIHLQERP